MRYRKTLPTKSLGYLSLIAFKLSLKRGRHRAAKPPILVLALLFDTGTRRVE